ncbi:MAG: hypothetical protein EOO92_00800 [Pedobacter sp.]|nr:MAG: hypothetical protein EOO92_00800 [Pedobacter sp.]
MACRKTEQITTDKNSKLAFSTDTVLFDTVFTAVGSVNKRIKVFNYDKKTINISEIKLGGGSNSFFSLIINGLPATEQKNLNILGEDSVSIYIKATINPSNQNQPFIVEDSILFNTNGNAQSVKLIAYGQNAVFVNNQTIESNVTWSSSLPYIINKHVTIAEGVTLNILQGTKVLFHGNAGMNVKGTLNAQGSANNPVLFASDRMENFYENEPGQWMGIRIFPSSNNSKINFATIKNATIGIVTDSITSNGSPKLLLTNSTIKNMTIASFTGYHSSLHAFNNLFYNGGQYLIYGIGGGQYNLKQNTFAGYNNFFSRRTPSLYFSDLEHTGFENLNVELKNNLIWGNQTEELQVDKKTSATVSTNITSNIIKTALQTYSANNFLNVDPKFADVNGYNFKLQNGSPALSKGENLSADSYYHFLMYDLLNKPRAFPSDLGCYVQ